MTILTLKEAAEYIRVKPSYLRQLIRDGIVPYRQCRDGCRITFSKEALEDWWMESSKPLPARIRIKKLRLIKSHDYKRHL